MRFLEELHFHKTNVELIENKTKKETLIERIEQNTERVIKKVETRLESFIKVLSNRLKP